MANLKLLRSTLEDTLNNFLLKYKQLFDGEQLELERRMKQLQNSFRLAFERKDFYRIHQNFCKLMFKMAESGEKLWIRIDHTYNAGEDCREM